jgi:hypothetical protein
MVRGLDKDAILDSMPSILAYDRYAIYNLVSAFKRVPGFMTSCPMCRSKLFTTGLNPTASYQKDYELMLIPVHHYTYLHQCPECGWWGIREFWEDVEAHGANDFLTSGILTEWDISSKSIPISILTNYLQTKDPKSDYKLVNSLVFEKLIAECLRYEYAPCEVYHVGARGGEGDRGVDIFMIKDDTEWLIQVKRRVNDKLESVDAVRMLNGVLLREGKRYGMVITSAPHFTKHAESETEVKTSGAYSVRLLDRGAIHGMIARLPRSEEPPWERSTADPYMYGGTVFPMSEEFAALFAPYPGRELDDLYREFGPGRI